MVSFTSGSASAAYRYDCNGLRGKKVSGGTTTVYVFSGAKVIAEYVNGSLSKEYVYSGRGLLATIAGTATANHHSDHVSVRLSTNSSGTKIGEQGNFPFGESWYLTNTTTKWQFTTHERDAPSGRVVQQSYDAIGRPCAIAASSSSCTSFTTPYASGFGYNTAFETTGLGLVMG